MTKVRIRVADWRDWREIQALRDQLEVPFDGGLYELLHWPIYHVHYAMPEATQDVIAFSSVSLLTDQLAEDSGTLTVPKYRNQGIACQLRLTQVRDLIEMGWQYLFVQARTPEAKSWCKGYMSSLGQLDDNSEYFGGRCTDIMDQLLDGGTPVPHQLSPDNRARLAYKAGLAIQDLGRLEAVIQQQVQKANFRQNYLA